MILDTKNKGKYIITVKYANSYEWVAEQQCAAYENGEKKKNKNIALFWPIFCAESMCLHDSQGKLPIKTIIKQ